MKKYNVIPALLLVYLGVMCYLGYPHLVSGEYSPFRYFGVTIISLALIAGVRYNMKQRSQQRSNKQ